MTVSELITILGKMPQEADVFLYDYEKMMDPGFELSGVKQSVVTAEQANDNTNLELSAGRPYILLQH